MAKKSPKELKDEGVALGALIAKARKKPHNFALVIAKDEGVVLEADPRKASAVMWRQAKANGGTSKGTMGTFSVRGKLLEFTVEGEDSPPKVLLMQTKKHLKDRGLAFKVAFVMPSGESISDDGDEDDEEQPKDIAEADAPDEQEEDKSTDDRAEALTAKIKELAAGVQKLAASNQTAAAKMAEGLKRASDAVASGNYGAAESTIAKIEKALGAASAASETPAKEDAGGPGPTVPDVDTDAMRAAVEKAYKDVEGKLVEIKQAGGTAVSKKAGQLEAAYANFLKSDDFQKATGLINLAKTFVEKEYGKLEKSASGFMDTLSEMASDAVETVKEVVSDVAEAADDFVDSLTEDGRKKLELQRLGYSEEEQDSIVAALKTDPNAVKKAKEKLVDEANVPDTQKAALKKLTEKNPKSFEAAMNTLKDLEADGPVDAGPEKIAEGKAALDTAQKTEAEKLAVFNVANTALNELKSGNPAPNSDWAKGLAKADAAEKAWKDFNDALPDPASMTESERNEAMLKGMELDRLRKEATQSAEEAKALDIKAAQDAAAAAKDKHDTAKKDTEAAAESLKKQEAKQGILNAITVGPLSANHGAPFDDAVSAKFIEGFQKDPGLTTKAIESATGARHPEAVANALGGIADKLSAGFADKDGKTLPEGADPRAYAEKLIQTGSYCGPEYFDKLDAYIVSGAHLEDSGFNDDPNDKSNVRAQKRSVATASAMIDGDGNLDVESEAAQKAVGNLLFHPDAMEHPMPTMSDTALRTLEELKKPKAGEIINGMTKPTVGGGAQELVGRAVGVTGPVSADQAKTAVLATMLKSLDQGPVGSCFSTAPSRNLREGQPLVAMEKYAEIASTGKLTTAKGPKTPVITETPPGEDPIMRSFEYTLATALARNEASTQFNAIKGRNEAGAAAIRGDVATAMGKEEPEVGKDIAKILLQIRRGFEIQYDPNAKLDGVSGDGHSSQGRHVLVEKATKTVITSREKFVAAVTPMVLKALGLEADSDAAKALKPKIEAEFVDAMVTTKQVTKPDGTTETVVDRAPWKMASGGQTGEAVEQLFGETDYNVALAENYDYNADGDPIPKSNTRAKQGARTAQVLEDLVGTFGADPADMIVIRTVGIHGFNAMPNDPSLKPILEGEGTVEDRIKSTLIDPGAKIASDDMSVEQTQQYYDDKVAASRKHVERWISEASTPHEKQRLEGFLGDFDTAAKDNRPTEGKTPTELADLIKTVRTAAHFSKPDAGRNAMAAELITDLGAPEVVIADTNWGDSTYHVYIVAAPDPMSGEVILWKKYDPLAHARFSNQNGSMPPGQA
ncbi:hypothetical protein ACERZ8_03995 [Tateyamaria armeniaca]|uniref:Large polyvalent protein-associated domain-containing protein n=1 Tax=Tateyamaria armeniaca TaxID=2518930 RepID=A0ABW8UPQ2_9RHOB